MDNQREFFRITLYQAPVTVYDLWVKFKGEIRDISGNGIGFHSKDEFEMGKEIRVKFSVKNKEFDIKAKIVRKKIGTLGRYLYGCKFLEQKEKDKSDLSAILLRLEADRRKK